MIYVKSQLKEGKRGLLRKFETRRIKFLQCALYEIEHSFFINQCVEEEERIDHLSKLFQTSAVDVQFEHLSVRKVEVRWRERGR